MMEAFTIGHEELAILCDFRGGWDGKWAANNLLLACVVAGTKSRPYKVCGDQPPKCERTKSRCQARGSNRKALGSGGLAPADPCHQKTP
jgi:hypothetical protein